MPRGVMTAEDASACASLADSPKDADAFEAAAQALEYYEAMRPLDGLYALNAEGDIVAKLEPDTQYYGTDGMRVVRLAIVEVMPYAG